MGIAEELETLQELHEKGKLTDSEYSAAKAAALKTEPQQSAAFKAGRFIGRRALPLLFVLLAFLAFVWYNAGTKQTGQMLATAVHAPIQLVNEVENVPANSLKGVPFTTTYSGSVSINLQVIHGNPMDVFVTDGTQFANINASGKNVLVYPDFNAQKTQSYDRTGQLQTGSYYLVLRDTSLGILSASASDISIKIQLKP